MNITFKIIALSITTFSFMFLASCQSETKEELKETTSTEAAISIEKLTPHSFVLVEFNGQKLSQAADSAPPTLDFSQWPTLGGKICNSFSGQGELSGQTIKMENAATTMMLCPDATLDKIEPIFHQMLHQGAQAVLQDGTLTLRGTDNTFIFNKQ